MLRHAFGTDTRFYACVTSTARDRGALATLCLQSTFTLSVTVAGLGFNFFRVRPSRPLSGLVVVRCSGQAEPRPPLRRCLARSLQPELKAESRRTALFSNQFRVAVDSVPAISRWFTSPLSLMCPECALAPFRMRLHVLGPTADFVLMASGRRTNGDCGVTLLQTMTLSSMWEGIHEPQ
jgi:hypothetical protein